MTFIKIHFITLHGGVHDDAKLELLLFIFDLCYVHLILLSEKMHITLYKICRTRMIVEAENHCYCKKSEAKTS